MADDRITFSFKVNGCRPEVVQGDDWSGREDSNLRLLRPEDSAQLD